MSRFLLCVAAALALAAGPVFAADPADQDRRFIEQAAAQGGGIVSSAELALRRAVDGRVRTFAQRMVEDQRPINQELIVLAQDAGVVLVAADVPDTEVPDTLAGLSGAAFDRAYLDESALSHETLAALFERQVAEGDDGRLRNFAANHLPALRQRLDIARSLTEELGGEADGP